MKNSAIFFLILVLFVVSSESRFTKNPPVISGTYSPYQNEPEILEYQADKVEPINYRICCTLYEGKMTCVGC